MQLTSRNNASSYVALNLPCMPQVTRGLLQKYGPERVKDTPITEVRKACREPAVDPLLASSLLHQPVQNM